jgi:metal-sulfur cluster biosynthetic enzyme
MTGAVDDAVRAALHQVCDPCSIAAQAPVSIIDMGLVRDWKVDDNGELVVRMALTSPSCTMGPHMMRAAEALLSDVPGIISARVEVDPTVFWTPGDMTEGGRGALASRRENSLLAAAIRPQQWRERASHRIQQEHVETDIK